MTLRELDVPASQWRLQDITAVRKVLADVGTDPALAQAWQGSVVLNFEEVPEVIPTWIRRLPASYEICIQRSHISYTF